MNVDIYREQYEFSCRQCGEIWRATYDVRQVVDGQGGVWHHFSRAGAPTASPVAGIVCTNCKQPSLVYQLIDRHRVLANATPTTRDEVLNAIEEPFAADEREARNAQGQAATKRPRGQGQDSSEQIQRTSRIVVGVDGSQSGLRALRWAGAEALTKGAELEIVVAWERAAGFGFTGTSSDEFEDELRRRVEGHMTEALGRAPRVPFPIAVHEGRPAQVLVEAAQGADLLVVGSNGNSAFAKVMLGSVSEYCVRHAGCSVVVVRDES